MGEGKEGGGRGCHMQFRYVIINYGLPVHSIGFPKGGAAMAVPAAAVALHGHEGEILFNFASQRG